MTRRVWAIAIFLGFAALLLTSTQASAERPLCHQGCLRLVTTTPQATEPPTDPPLATTSPDFSNTEVLSLAQPTATPPLSPDGGFAESQPVSQANAQSTVFGTAPIPKNNDSFAAAPGFGPIGIPMLLAFALMGLISLTIFKRI